MAQVARIDFESVERPYIMVCIAGEEHQLPITFNDADLALVGSFGNEADKGFKAFFAKYLGDVVYEMGDNQLSQLLTSWQAEREALTGVPELGES